MAVWGGWQGPGWFSLWSMSPLGTRVSNKRTLPMVASERRFWATSLAPPPLPPPCELPQGRQQQARQHLDGAHSSPPRGPAPHSAAWLPDPTNSTGRPPLDTWAWPPPSREGAVHSICSLIPLAAPIDHCLQCGQQPPPPQSGRLKPRPLRSPELKPRKGKPRSAGPLPHQPRDGTSAAEAASPSLSQSH